MIRSCSTIARTILCLMVLAFGVLPQSRAADKPAPVKVDVSYGPHEHQLLDLYVPAGDGPFPVLVWFGGLWKPAKHVPDVNRFFAAKCAVVGVQMRVMQDAIDAKIHPPVSVCLLDGARAVQFVRLHAKEWKLDPDRIAVGGGSQGALPALYVGCAKDRANPNADDLVERMSTQVVGIGAYRSQPSIDPQRMQEWVPGVEWGAPAFGVSFAESLKQREKFLPDIAAWSPESLLHAEAAPIYFENNWGLTQPENVGRMDYLVHAPQWGLGFQKLAEAKGVTCYVKYPGVTTDRYADIWDFLIRRLAAKEEN